jgi:DNA helicase TIP49 (TBP-interacting protein)
MATVPVSEVKSNARESRTAAHSHIKGLGLSSDGRATPSAGGFIGQAAAREVQQALGQRAIAVLTTRRHAVWS